MTLDVQLHGVRSHLDKTAAASLEFESLFLAFGVGSCSLRLVAVVEPLGQALGPLSSYIYARRMVLNSIERTDACGT